MRVYMLYCFFVSVVFGHGIIEAGDNDFESKAFGKPGKYSLVNFYSSNCQHCLNLKPNWDPLGELYNNTNLQVIQVNGLQSKRVRSKYQIIAFPTIKLYSSEGEQIGAFSKRGDRSTENLIKFVNDYTGIKPNELESNEKYISSVENFNSLPDQDKLILFTSPWVKDFQNRYNNYFQQNSKLHKDLQFIIIDTSLPELSELSSKFKIDTIPTVVMLQDSKYHKLIDVTRDNLESMLDGEHLGQFQFELNDDGPVLEDEDDEDDEDTSFEEFRKLREL